MVQADTRLCLPATPPAREQNWNVIEFSTQKHIRQHITRLLHLCSIENATTDEIRQELLYCQATCGSPFTTHLVRALQRDNEMERQSITWLLTVLNAPETIQPLQQLATNHRLPRATRLAAALALAGMGAPTGTPREAGRPRLYAIS